MSWKRFSALVLVLYAASPAFAEKCLNLFDVGSMKGKQSNKIRAIQQTFENEEVIRGMIQEGRILHLAEWLSKVNKSLKGERPNEQSDLPKFTKRHLEEELLKREKGGLSKEDVRDIQLGNVSDLKAQLKSVNRLIKNGEFNGMTFNVLRVIRCQIRKELKQRKEIPLKIKSKNNFKPQNEFTPHELERVRNPRFFGKRVKI